jgi:anti-sigma factor RsiW
MAKMLNHQPFETWLLSEDPLSPEQALRLQAHLKGCEACRQLAEAWSGIEQLFRTVPAARPASGFTTRWQARLAEAKLQEKRRKHHRQTWWMLVINFGAAALLLLTLILGALFIYESPARLMLAGAYQVVMLISFLNAVQEIFTALVIAVLTIVPPLGWALIGGALAVLNVLWIVSLRQIILPWRLKL